MKIEELDKLWGPHKRYPIAFVDYPDANLLLDMVPKLIAVAKAAKTFVETWRYDFEEYDAIEKALAELDE